MLVSARSSHVGVRQFTPSCSGIARSLVKQDPGAFIGVFDNPDEKMSLTFSIGSKAPRGVCRVKGVNGNS